tara:strand:+ start:2545 stop:3345 length:801 start_codon:yes stop_codon:yes gene_type:complete
LVKNIFNKQYTQYWKEAVNKSVDGTIIADKSIAKIFLDKVALNKDCISLDLGCSYGRMFDLLSMYSTIVYGVDIDKSAVDEAQKRNYDAVMVSSSTNINLPNKSLNLIFCWAVFEVLDHCKTLSEMNRLLSMNGNVLFTAKNDNYSINDNLAFAAEKNAYLKEFPNSFINIPFLIKNLKKTGFKLEKLFIFKKRGDLGLGKYTEIKDFNLQEFICYEFLMILKKDKNNQLKNSTLSFGNKFSKNSIRLAKAKGFSSPEKLFRLMGL